jgi:hypothetical protein
MNKQKRKFHSLSEIRLWLDTYNDIFSSFDSRPYHQRALSIDFLDEAERASREKSVVPLELKLHMPTRKRSLRDESMIRRRLKHHFNKHLKILHKERSDIIKKGLAFVIFGIAIMLLATFVIFTYGGRDILTTFLGVLLEPAGWFLFWEGLDIILFESKKLSPKLIFYKKMSKCRIDFESY